MVSKEKIHRGNLSSLCIVAFLEANFYDHNNLKRCIFYLRTQLPATTRNFAFCHRARLRKTKVHIAVSIPIELQKRDGAWYHVEALAFPDCLLLPIVRLLYLSY